MILLWALSHATTKPCLIAKSSGRRFDPKPQKPKKLAIQWPSLFRISPPNPDMPRLPWELSSTFTQTQLSSGRSHEIYIRSFWTETKLPYTFQHSSFKRWIWLMIQESPANTHHAQCSSYTFITTRWPKGI